MANRIPPPDPESHRLSQAKKLEEAQKVAAISSVDPDAQAKKRRFQQAMNGPDDEEKVKDEAAQQPSPFQSSFYQANKPSDLDLESIPSPYNAQPPDLSAPSPQAEDLLSDNGLPQSPEYWNQVDLPDQPIETLPQFTQDQSTQGQSAQENRGSKQEKGPESKQRESKRYVAPERGTKKIEPSPFGPPDKLVAKKEVPEKTAPPFTPKKEKENALPKKNRSEEFSPPTAKYWEHEPGELRNVAPKEKEKTKKGVDHPISEAKSTPPEFTPPKETSSFLQKESSEGKDHQKHESKTTIDLIQPTSTSFTPSVHSAASTAAEGATPYLRPETVPLFYQMTGTILMMTNQGINTTEILLNNPAFAGSKFFGASIEITKYSSAPGSFNIRLTGSNEAVTAFNQNIPSLMNAFQAGGFRFRVGRIDAVYATERPLFRRKEKKGDHSSGKDMKGNDE
jgi:hypothetical protein